MKNIKFSLYGQVENDTLHIFTFPTAFNAAFSTPADEWLKSLFDPRDNRVFGSNRTYVMWKNQRGNYYSVIVPSHDDPRNGRLMVTIFTEQCRPTAGQAIVNALNQLEGLLINEGVRNINDPRFVSVATQLSGKLTFDNNTAPDAMRTQNISGFSTYKTADEIAAAFEATNLLAKNNVGKLFINPAGASITDIVDARFKKVAIPMRATRPAQGGGQREIGINVFDSYSGNNVRGTVSVNTSDPIYTLLVQNPQLNTGRGGSSSGGGLKWLTLPLAAMGCYFLLATGLSFAGINLWPFSGHKQQVEQTATPEATADQQPSQAQPNAQNSNTQAGKAQTTNENPQTQPQDNSTPEDIDREYLKRSDTWEASLIQSPQYQELFSLLASGNIEGTLSRPVDAWFPGGQVNGYFKNIYSRLEAANSNQKGKISDEMRRIARGGRIDLQELLTAIGNVTNPQPAPQPQQPAQQSKKKPEPQNNTKSKNGSASSKTASGNSGGGRKTDR